MINYKLKKEWDRQEVFQMEIIWKRKDEFTLQPKLYDIPEVLAMTALISLLGFIVENLWMLTRSGFIDNRNMNLPFLLGYGLAVVGMYLLIGTPKKGHFLFYFTIVFFMVSFGEIALGFLVESSAASITGITLAFRCT